MSETHDNKPTGMDVVKEDLIAEACKQFDTTVTIENVEFELGKRIEDRETEDKVPKESEASNQNMKPAYQHREVEDVNERPQITKNARRNKEYEAWTDDMNTLKAKYEETKYTIEEEIRNITLTKTLVLKDIKNYKKELLSRLDILEKRSIEAVNERFKQITENMKMTSRKIDEILQLIDETLKESDFDKKTQTERNEQVAVIHDKGLKTNANVEGYEGISVCFDKSIKTLFDGTTGLVKINRPCQAIPARIVDITFESDRETCGISDICSLPDGTVVMTDLSNDCLKRLDESYNRKSVLHLVGGPLGICATKNGELAVTLRESRVIQFVEYTATEMKVTKSFPANCSCNYISCIDNALYVTCEGGDEDNKPGHVRKFNMTGNLLHVIEKDDKGRRLFTTPLHITSNADKSRLYITDMDSKVIILDKTGKKLGQYGNTLLESPFGISVLPNDNVLVSSVDSHCVQQFDEKCRYVGTVLNKGNGLENPVCIKFNALCRQVIVSMDDSNTLLVFNATFTSA